MKLLVILFSAFFLAALFDVELAVAQTVRPSQAVSTANPRALDECRARYARCGRDVSPQIARLAASPLGNLPYRSLRCMQKMTS